MIVNGVNTVFRPLNTVKTQNQKNSSNKSSGIQSNSQRYLPQQCYRLISPSLSFGSLGFDETLTTFYRFKPDKYQIEAAKSIYNGDNTLVTAPTGTGKTLIAEYAINKNIKEGKVTYYTTPLKALSNQKYFDFCNLYGEENVAIKTGDVDNYSKNQPNSKPDAKVVVMTTEIYRNMVVNKQENNDQLKKVNTVVFDEFHYMDDTDRGCTWEESVIFTPEHVQIIPLSATIGNADKINGWLNSIHDKQSNLVKVSTQDRHVPLQYYVFTEKFENHLLPLVNEKININKLKSDYAGNNLHEKSLDALTKISQAYGTDVISAIGKVGKDSVSKRQFADKLVKTGKFNNEEALKLASRLVDKDQNKINSDISGLPPYEGNKMTDFIANKKLIKDLNEKNMLPAIFFVMSKNKCNEYAEDFVTHNSSLLDKKEQKELNSILNQYEKNNEILGLDYNREQLLKGVAVHHAGVLPSYKNLVEKLFQKKLIKVVFATETLAAGINMPAKTVVMTALEKPTSQLDEEGKMVSRLFTPNEYHQMTGRAGRRGMDEIGNVVIMENKNTTFEDAYDLTISEPNDIESKLHPSYSFLTTYFQKNRSEDNLNKFIDKSFYSFQEDNETKRDLKDNFNIYKGILEKYNFIKPVETPYTVIYDGTSNKQNPKVTAKNEYITTEKGKFVNDIRGVNEILLAELIYDGSLSAMTPQELASCVASFAYKNDNVKSGQNKKSGKESDVLLDLQKLLSDNCKILGLKDGVSDKQPIKKETCVKLQASIDREFQQLSKSEYASKSTEELNQEKKLLDKKAKSIIINTDLSVFEPQELLEKLNDDSLFIDKSSLELLSRRVKNKLKDKVATSEKLQSIENTDSKADRKLKSAMNKIVLMQEAQNKISERLDNYENSPIYSKSDIDSFKSRISDITYYQSRKVMLEKTSNLLTQIRDVSNFESNKPVDSSVDIVQTLKNMDLRVKKLEQVQKDAGMDPTQATINFNPNIAPYIISWANGTESGEYKDWNEFAAGLIMDSVVNNEGDLFKLLNSSVDVLKQISSISESQSKIVSDGLTRKNLHILSKSADEAIKLISKPPIGNGPQDLNI